MTFRHSRDVHPWRATLHRTLRRHRTRWVLTTLLAFIAVLWTVTTVSDAERESHAWGDRRTVAVARRDLLPGEVITDDSIEWAPRPTIMLTDDVAADAVGRTVTHAVAAGEIVIERRLSGGTATGPGALLEPDALAFAVPVDASTPTLAIGVGHRHPYRPTGRRRLGLRGAHHDRRRRGAGPRCRPRPARHIGGARPQRVIRLPRWVRCRPVASAP